MIRLVTILLWVLMLISVLLATATWAYMAAIYRLLEIGFASWPEVKS
jgi:hypothetical protein